ncbi:MAG: energy transducer TonB [Rhodobacteraceae bacterium]|nr:MAG: energy transducer TonB [Paracoccaceae bacterium]
MIRRSTAIATAAILLSLLVHFLGIGFSVRVQPERPDDKTTSDVVALGNAFEDVAETLPEPVAPEKTPAPEPPKETIPEPERVEALTSEVLVASPNPQRTNSPDTGSAPVVHQDRAGSPEPVEGRVPEPETVKPSGAEEGTTTQAAIAPPVEPATAVEAPKGTPDVRPEPVEAVIPQPLLSLPVTPEPQQLAALPASSAPALPVTPAPVPLAIPVIPLERETVAPVTPETTVAPTPEESETVKPNEDAGDSELAVVTSLRPPSSAFRLPIGTPGQRDGSEQFSDLRNPPPMESPLTVYQRDGIDLFAQGSRRSQSGGAGSQDFRNPGNSDVTNYAGQVLMHLNRSPPVRLTARGYARILFEINADGSLARVDILDSTGSQEIERAAKAQVRNAAPFPRPPKGAGRRLTFVYWNN